MNTQKLKQELARNVRDHKYEVSDSGILFPAAKVHAYGVFDISVNGGPTDFFSNLVTAQGLNHMAGVVLGAVSKISTWYIAPFAGNATPASGWTAANFDGNATEFTNYDELTRQTFSPGSASGGAINNLSTRAEFTVGDGGQDEIYGGGLISVSGKQATTGVLFSAGRLPSPRQNLQEGDVIALGYTFTISDAG